MMGPKISPKTLSIKSDATGNCQELISGALLGAGLGGGSLNKTSHISWVLFDRVLSLSVTKLIMPRQLWPK
jgi:hypothetical protein